MGVKSAKLTYLRFHGNKERTKTSIVMSNKELNRGNPSKLQLNGITHSIFVDNDLCMKQSFGWREWRSILQLKKYNFQ